MRKPGRLRPRWPPVIFRNTRPDKSSSQRSGMWPKGNSASGRSDAPDGRECPAKPSQAETEQAASFTAREKEILGLFCQGMSYTETAEAVGYLPLTIRNSIYGIRNKLEVKSKPEMVVWAVRSGLLDT